MGIFDLKKILLISHYNNIPPASRCCQWVVSKNYPPPSKSNNRHGNAIIESVEQHQEQYCSGWRSRDHEGLGVDL
jgi:hypothetical protein